MAAVPRREQRLDHEILEDDEHRGRGEEHRRDPAVRPFDEPANRLQMLTCFKSRRTKLSPSFRSRARQTWLMWVHSM